MTTVERLVAGLLVCGALAGVSRVAADAPYTLAFATLAPLNTGVFIANADGSGERMLVRDPQFDANPSLSPDGQWVVFSSRRHGSVDLYRVRADGGQLERLTDDIAYDDQPVVAPDGRHVAFVSSRGGQADIWVLDLQTRAARNLTSHRGGDYRPAYSPDGQWIAFTSDRDSEGAGTSTGRPALTGRSFAPLQHTQIYIMRTDGSDVRRLTEGDSAVGGASWSPDGKALTVFEASPEHWLSLARSFASPGAVSQIVRVDVATGARTPLTTGPGRKFAPQWLADGRIAYTRSDTEEQPPVASGSGRRRPDYWSERIAFTNGTNGPAGMFIGARWSPDGQRMVFHRFVEKAPPPVRRVVSPDPMFRLVHTGTFPSYSPDGRQIVDTDNSQRISESDLPRHTRMFIMNADGSNRRVLFERATESAMGPVWAPRGDVIAFGLGVSMPRQGQYGSSQIAIMAPDGSGVRRVTPNGEGNYHFPSWSPDGTRLVLRVATPTSKGLAILDVASGRLTPLTPGADSDDNLPKWSPNGTLIVFTSDRDGDYDLYAIRPDGTALTRLTNTPGNDAHAAWSPDGRWIAFSSARGGFKDEAPRGGGGQPATDIFVMRPDGTDLHRLTDDAAEEGTVAFAPR